MKLANQNQYLRWPDDKQFLASDAFAEWRNAAGDINPEVKRWTGAERISTQMNPETVGGWLYIISNPWKHINPPISGWDPNRWSKAGTQSIRTEIPVSKVSHGHKSQIMPHAPARTNVLKIWVSWHLYKLRPDHQRPRQVNTRYGCRLIARFVWCESRAYTQPRSKHITMLYGSCNSKVSI